MDNFVFGVNLEYKSIVYLVRPEYLYVYTSSYDYEHHHKSKDVGCDTWIKFLPSIVLVTDLRQY